MSVCYVTTIDNPYNPFTESDQWLTFDLAKGYNTNAYVARVGHFSTELTDEEYDYEVESTVDEICRLNINGMYKKVFAPPEYSQSI